MKKNTLRLAALSDIHYDKHARGRHDELWQQIAAAADVLLLCGDLTDYGLPEEGQHLVHDLRAHLRIPILAVLGNHDYESGHVGELCTILEEGGVNLLDGECAEVEGVGFAGVRGFAGGFDRWMLNGWGEPPIKAFVQAAVDEEIKLEKALSKLGTPTRVVLLHYAPIRATVEGEPCEIVPFLGSSRLEEPLNRYDVTVAFHGHAHAGAPEGATAKGIPVYNVAVPVLQRHYPDRPAFRVFEVARGEAAGQNGEVAAASRTGSTPV